MKLIIKTFIIYFIFLISFSYSEIIKSFKISGNDRISDETVILFSKVNVNDQITKDYELNQIFKNIYETNFFSDVKINFQNNVLAIEVVENPIILKVKINGVKAKRIKEQIYDKLELKDKSPFIKYYAEKDIINISNNLKRSGFYFSNVKLEIEEHSNNAVNLIYNIDLGDKAPIKKINFIGKKIFKDRKLRNVIVTEEDRFWKFLTSSIYLNEDRINLDNRLLKNFYLNKGYYKVKIESNFATFTGTNNFDLTFKINAGKKFYFNDFKLNLPNDYEKKHFVKINEIFKNLKNEPYSLREIEKIIKIIEDISIDHRYEFVDANFRESIIDSNKLDLAIDIKESPDKFFVNEINIFGNTITEESVLRNNLLISEGDAFNKIIFEKSINNLKGLGIFESVKSKIVSSDDQNKRDIEIEIEEKATGEISAGAGVGSSGGTIGGGIQENNYLGKGIVLSANLTLNEESVKGEFDYFNPNYKNTDKSLAFGLQSTVTDKLADFGYKSTDSKIHLGTRYQQYDDLYFSPNISISYDKIETSTTASSSLKKQKGDYFVTNFNYLVDYDKRNQKFQTTSGHRHRFSQMIPIYSEALTLRNTYKFNKYLEVTDKIVSSFSFYGSTITALDTSEDVRISQRLMVPSNLLRGFEPGRIGPIDGDDHVGGNYASAINFNTDLPVFEGWQDAEVKYFFDAANVWSTDYRNYDDDSSKIRTSTGVAIDWFTAVGPLTFSFAKPITKKETDRTEKFRFNIGTSF